MKTTLLLQIGMWQDIEMKLQFQSEGSLYSPSFNVVTQWLTQPEYLAIP